MLSLWLIVACNTPETVEVPPLPTNTAQTVENTQPPKNNTNDTEQKKDLASNEVKSEQPSQPTTKRTSPFLSEVMQLPLKVVKFRGEWIELYNPTEETVDLSTYSIHSKDDTGVSFTKEHTIPPKSTFLMAVRKSPTGNGGLPKVDFLYNHGVLKVAGTDWIELRNGTEVVDRWELSRKEVREGYSLQRNEDGTVCYSTEPYGDGDFGSPKTLHSCQ